ncbi:HK97 family phage prohead protease [Microvirga yunnanensis]|uniref:HK97 family phage prohead protease n=1 Tax=Microvirga yunnanensis TaxID=2953740 RepID=UPI0021C9C642|nr:HK97 family phage prohead protease [Microvirga sp. HBU67655]
MRQRSKVQTRSAAPAADAVTAPAASSPPAAVGAVARRADATFRTRSGSVDVAARTFEAVASTETPVRRYVDIEGMGYVQADEILVTTGVDLSAVAGVIPLLDGHDASSTDAILGSIEGARTETVEGLGDVVILSCRIVEGVKGDEVLAKLASGALTAVSVGYRVANYDIETRDGQTPIARAVEWSLVELSLVPVGADPNARVRSAEVEPVVPAADLEAAPAEDGTATIEAAAAETVQAAAVETRSDDVPAADDLAPLEAAVGALADAIRSIREARSQRAAAPATVQEPAPADVTQAAPAAAADPEAQAPVTDEQPAQRAAPQYPDTREVYAALRAARSEDPRATTIRALARALELGDVGERLVQQGASVEVARMALHDALAARTAGGAEISTRSAPGEEVTPSSSVEIDQSEIYARMRAARTQTR